MLLVAPVLGAYTAISSYSTMATNTATRAPASWTSVGVNGSINYFAWPNGYDIILLFNCTYLGSGGYFSIMKGDNPPAFRSGIGNLTITPTAVGNHRIGPLESARFKNSTGYLQVSGNKLQGTISVINVPKW